MIINDMINPSMPQSVTSMPINMTAMVVVILAFVGLEYFGPDFSTLTKATILLSVVSGTIMILEGVFSSPFRRASTGIDWASKASYAPKRVTIKLLGFVITLLLVAIFYWLLPEYRGRWYSRYYQFLTTFLPWIVVLAVPYFFVVDRVMVDPHDGYAQVGYLFLGKFKDIDRSKIKQHLLGWMVKGYFLPLMFVELLKKIEYFSDLGAPVYLSDVKELYDFLYSAIFGIDLLWVTVGYLVSMRIFDTHIRSTESTVVGWTVALVCYQPFWSLFERQYLRYDSGNPWGEWFEENSVGYAVWACLIIICLIIYLWATVSFGLRFSNLTHRGIITNGPYRFCKHPAYVSKNVAWWLITMPFMPSEGVLEAVRHSLLLLGLNIIYYLRARTEEKHLSQDGVYVAYAEYVDKHGIFRWLPKNPWSKST